MDIVHYFLVSGSIESVYAAISTSRGLAKWWTMGAKGHSELGGILELDFGPDFQWQAQVTQMVPSSEFEIVLIKADTDWVGSTVGFKLRSTENGTDVRFFHKGWKEANDHYYISCYCWAMYLRLMKRYVEYGEFVEYEERLNV